MPQEFSNFNEVFNFGKYKNEKLSKVFSINPGYINWGIENNIIQLTDELKIELDYSSSKKINDVQDFNIDDLLSHVMDIFSLKMSIESLFHTVETGIHISVNEEYTNDITDGLSSSILELFKGQRLLFRKSLLKNLITKYQADLYTKISQLFDFISNKEVTVSASKLIYIHSEQLPSSDLVTINFEFLKTENGYSTLYIYYKDSLIYDVHIFEYDKSLI